MLSFATVAPFLHRRLFFGDAPEKLPTGELSPPSIVAGLVDNPVSLVASSFPTVVSVALPKLLGPHLDLGEVLGEQSLVPPLDLGDSLGEDFVVPPLDVGDVLPEVSGSGVRQYISGLPSTPKGDPWRLAVGDS